MNVRIRKIDSQKQTNKPYGCEKKLAASTTTTTKNVVNGKAYCKSLSINYKMKQKNKSGDARTHQYIIAEIIECIFLPICLLGFYRDKITVKWNVAFWFNVVTVSFEIVRVRETQREELHTSVRSFGDLTISQ